MAWAVNCLRWRRSRASPRLELRQPHSARPPTPSERSGGSWFRSEDVAPWPPQQWANEAWRLPPGSASGLRPRPRTLPPGIPARSGVRKRAQTGSLRRLHRASPGPKCRRWRVARKRRTWPRTRPSSGPCRGSRRIGPARRRGRTRRRQSHRTSWRTTRCRPGSAAPRRRWSRCRRQRSESRPSHRHVPRPGPRGSSRRPRSWLRP